MDSLQWLQLVDGCGLLRIVLVMWILFTTVAALWKVMDCLQSSPLVDGCGLLTFVAALCFFQLLQ